jgi:hypothetical protein
MGKRTRFEGARLEKAERRSGLQLHPRKLAPAGLRGPETPQLVDQPPLLLPRSATKPPFRVPCDFLLGYY